MSSTWRNFKTPKDDRVIVKDKAIPNGIVTITKPIVKHTKGKCTETAVSCGKHLRMPFPSQVNWVRGGLTEHDMALLRESQLCSQPGRGGAQRDCENHCQIKVFQPWQDWYPGADTSRVWRVCLCAESWPRIISSIRHQDQQKPVETLFALTPSPKDNNSSNNNKNMFPVTARIPQGAKPPTMRPTEIKPFKKANLSWAFPNLVLNNLSMKQPQLNYLKFWCPYLFLPFVT